MSVPVESDSDSATFVVAQTRSGVEKRFDTEHTVCAEFGFFAGERVHTPRGPAWVIGVNNGDLYFNIDGDKGASKWVGCKMADFQSRGFRLLFSNHQQRPPTGEGLAKRSLTNSHHAPHLRNLINDVQFSDITFLLDPETEDASQGGIDDGNPDDFNPTISAAPVRVHAMRGLLVARSEYFRSLFSRQNGMEESNKNEIRLHSVAPSIFLLVLEYLYCGAVQYQPHQAAPLLKAADLLLLFDLKTDCAQFLTRQVSRENCILLLQLANQFQLDILRLSCLECLIKHLPVRDSPLRNEWMALVSQQPDISLMLIDRLCVRLGSTGPAAAVSNPATTASTSSASTATSAPSIPLPIHHTFSNAPPAMPQAVVQAAPQMPLSAPAQPHVSYYPVSYPSLVPMIPHSPTRATSVNQPAPSPPTHASPSVSVWRLASVARLEAEEPTSKRTRHNDDDSADAAPLPQSHDTLHVFDPDADTSVAHVHATAASGPVAADLSSTHTAALAAAPDQSDEAQAQQP